MKKLLRENSIAYKKIWKTALMLVIVGLFNFSVYAKNYYVSLEGNDNNNGLSEKKHPGKLLIK